MELKTILHIIDSLGVGGAEVLLKHTLQLLPEYHHCVVCLSNAARQPHLEAPNVQVICLDHRGWKDFLPSVKKLRKIVSEVKPQLVHTHLFYATLLARVAVPSATPIVTTLHSTFSKDAFEKNKKSVWAERLTLKKHHALIGVSQYVLDDYLQWIPFKGEKFVLYNFVPHTFFRRPNGKAARAPLRCIAIGSLKEAKNYPYLLKIWEGLKGVDIELDIYGVGKLQKELQQEIDKKGLAVRLCGLMDNVPETLPRYDLFVQASAHEGFGLSVIEAMASSLPVAISDIPVFKEVTSGHGHFFPLDDKDIAGSLFRNLAEDDALRTKHVERAYVCCQERYSEKTYKTGLLNIYRSLLQS